MALADFFPRVADALRPIADVPPEALTAKLDGATVSIALRSTDPAAAVGFSFAVNLCSRLYPNLVVEGPAIAVSEVEGIARAINPQISITARSQDAAHALDPARGYPNFELVLGSPPTDDEDTSQPGTHIVVNAANWTIAVDPDSGTSFDASTDAPPSRNGYENLVWMAAAALGVSELFRSVFAAELGARGRRERQPGFLHVLPTPESSSGDSTPTRPAAARGPGSVDDSGPTDAPLDIGDVYLVGAGAIGQAFVAALEHASVTGQLHVVDPETITLSNLQRYVLTTASSVGADKGGLVADTLADSAIAVHPYTGRWGDDPSHLQVDTAISALDSATDRLALAASMPRRVFNAWTQVADMGWSRHENFGEAPCLACLYYPTDTRPNEHELIAEALGDHPLRVLGYLIYQLPIGFPLPVIPQVAGLQPTPDSGRWMSVSLLQDLVERGMIAPQQQDQWGAQNIGTIYRDGICAGGLLPVGELPGDVIVPLAHQSALAGTMLALELIIASDAELRAVRNNATEYRYDVHKGLPQVLPRPRARTTGCICSDPHYQAASDQNS